MADSSNPGEEPKSGETPGDDLAAVQAERDDLKKKHNKAFAENRTLKDRVAELEKSVADRDKADHSKSGDVDALRKTFQAELDASNEKLKQKELQLHSVIVEKEIRSIAGKHAVDDSDVWALLKDEFTVGEDDDGKPIAVCRNSALSPEKRILQFLEQKPHLAKNGRAKGTDTKGPNDSTVTTKTIDDVLRMSPAEQRKVDPKVAAEVLSKIRLPG